MIVVAKNHFKNEFGNNIYMSVSLTKVGFRVKAVGPSSSTNHDWTAIEAEQLYELLGKALRK